MSSAKQPKRQNRKVIQIAVAATETEDGHTETLYALDSTGQIWGWSDGSSKKMAGWYKLDHPWNHPQIERKT